MTSLLLDIGRTALAGLLLAYTVVAVAHYLLQLWYSHRTYRIQKSAAFAIEFPRSALDVDVIVPSYNETPELLDACVRSALLQDHDGRVRVFVVDDGSPNRAALDSTYDELERAGAVVIRSPKNVGKRHAQALALPLCEGEIIVTLDSDSVLAPDAVRMLTRQFADPKVGASTGFVDVKNRRANLLTRIQYLRYWMAFNQERAAQTAFRTVLCCSGPLAAYRRSIIESVRDAYLSQMYGGVACTYGDDRHLTNLVLGKGYDTVYDGGAVALTHVPETLRQFLKQQLRWNKSFYRELVWTIPFIGNRPWFSRFDVACQVAMPVMLSVAAGTALAVGLVTDLGYLLRYVGFIAIAATLRATYGAVRMRDPAFYLFVVYGYVSAFLLMSVRLRALATLSDARWGTRGPATVSRAAEAVSAFMASAQPLMRAAQTVSWPERRQDLLPSHDRFRPDSAWRAGSRTRMMAHPSVLDGVNGSATLGGSAGHETALVLDGSRVDRPAAAASVGAPARVPYPLGDWAYGPECGHAAAASSSARFCRACGSPYGRTFRPAPAPVVALRARSRAAGGRRSVGRAGDPPRRWPAS